MTAARIALVLLVSACGGGGTKPAGPVTGPVKADGCRADYAEYEQRWRIARGQELAEFGDSFGPDAIEEIVSQEVETLPDREELRKLRLMYTVVAVLVPDAPWVVAFAAAESAIETCGERARRPGAT